jgi:hypothetical protein
LLAEQQIEMIMFLRWMIRRENAQMTGHAQMDDQRAMRKVNQEIFAPSARRYDTLAREQLVETYGKRPAQTTATLNHAGDRAALEERRDAAAGDFDFG